MSAYIMQAEELPIRWDTTWEALSDGSFRDSLQEIFEYNGPYSNGTIRSDGFHLIDVNINGKNALLAFSVLYTDVSAMVQKNYMWNVTLIDPENGKLIGTPKVLTYKNLLYPYFDLAANNPLPMYYKKDDTMIVWVGTGNDVPYYQYYTHTSLGLMKAGSVKILLSDTGVSYIPSSTGLVDTTTQNWQAVGIGTDGYFTKSGKEMFIYAYPTRDENGIVFTGEYAIGNINTIDSFYFDTTYRFNLFEDLKNVDTTNLITDGKYNYVVNDTTRMLATYAYLRSEDITARDAKYFITATYNAETGKIYSKKAIVSNEMDAEPIYDAQRNTIVTFDHGQLWTEVVFRDMNLEQSIGPNNFHIRVEKTPLLNSFDSIEVYGQFYVSKNRDIYWIGCVCEVVDNTGGGGFGGAKKSLPYKAYIAKYSSTFNGELEWEKIWTPDSTEDCYARAFYECDNNDIIVLSYSGISPKRAKISATRFGSRVSIEDSLNMPNIMLSPNPTDDNITLSFMARATENYILTIYNTAGEIAYECEYFATEGENTLSLDLSSINLTNGAYYIKLVSPNATLNSNFVVKRN
jgi:hypothetical protein